MRRILWLSGALLLMIPASAQAANKITIAGLTPAYSSKQSDFTVNCSKPVKVAIKAARSTPVSLDGKKFRSGSTRSTIALKAGQRFSLVTKQGRRRTSQSVRCLPNDFPLWTTTGKASSQLGWMILAPNLFLDLSPSVMRPVETSRYVTVVNSAGVPVWWQKDAVAAPWDATLLPSGKLAWSRYNYDRATGALGSYRVYGWNGKQQGAITSPAEYPDSHELLATKDGGYLTLSSEPRNCPEQPDQCADLSPWGGPASATIMDSVIEKTDAKGKLLWQWSTKDHLSVADGARWVKLPSVQDKLSDGRTGWDIFHINSLHEDSTGIVFTARQADALYRIDKTSGEIIWKIGGTQHDYSLTVTGPQAAGMPLAGPHDAQLFEDGTVSAYDNGTGVRPPRIVRFRVTGSNAEMIEQITDPHVTFSACCGSARRLAGGDWLVANGGSSTIKELTPTGKVLLTVTIPNGSYSYRAKAVDLKKIKASALRAGMDTQYPRP